jgi:hypothetical protein
MPRFTSLSARFRIINDIVLIDLGISIPNGEKKKTGLPNDPNRWTVGHVRDYLKKLPNAITAIEFKRHQINHEAFLLLKMKHLLNRMNINLGSAFIRLNQVYKLREPLHE